MTYSLQASIDDASNKVSISTTMYSDIDGFSQGQPAGQAVLDKCSSEIAGPIPSDDYLVNVHKGFFFGHTFLSGNYDAVTSSLKAFYTEYYASKNECLLAVQPLGFSASLVKGECYFNSAHLLDGEDKHDWYKVLGFGGDEYGSYVEYSIHNNNDCEDLDKYAKAKKEKVYAPAEYAVGQCVWGDNFWMKRTAYN